MTSMGCYIDDTFNVVVFVKGALDSLMSGDTWNEIIMEAADMFREISRVLSVEGIYVCITLAEPFVLRHLLQHFMLHHQQHIMNLEISMHLIGNQRPSPFVPFFITVRMGSTSEKSDIKTELRLYFDRFGNNISQYTVETISSALDTVAHLQEFHQMKYRLCKHATIYKYSLFNSNFNYRQNRGWPI